MLRPTRTEPSWPEVGQPEVIGRPDGMAVLLGGVVDGRVMGRSSAVYSPLPSIEPTPTTT